MGLLNRSRILVLILVGLTLPIEARDLRPFGLPYMSLNKMVAAILVAFVAVQWAVERRPAPADSKRLWMLFFGVSVGLSVFQAYLLGLLPVAIFDVMSTSYTLILFYFVLIYALTSRKDLDLLLGSFIAGCVIAGGSGLLGFGEISESVRYGERVGGHGGNPNLLTFNLLIGIPMAAAFFYSSTTRAARLMIPCLIGVMTTGIVLSLTRTAYVAFPAMILFFALRFRRGSLLKYTIPAVALILLVGLFAPERVVERFLDLTSTESVGDLDRSARLRFTSIPSTFEAFASNPLTGVGLGGYRTWAREHGHYGLSVHNAYLQVLVEQGLLGFIPFMAIIVLSWRQISLAVSLARRHGLGDPELRILGTRSLFLQVAFVGPLIMGLAQPSNRHKGFWLLFALSTVVLERVRDRVREIEPARPPARQQWRGPPGSPQSAPVLDRPAG